MFDSDGMVEGHFSPRFFDAAQVHQDFNLYNKEQHGG
jgi:hypothetical protein